MRYVLLLLLLTIVGLSSDLGTEERFRATDLQPVLFAASLGSH